MLELADDHIISLFLVMGLLIVTKVRDMLDNGGDSGRAYCRFDGIFSWTLDLACRIDGIPCHRFISYKMEVRGEARNLVGRG